MSSRRRPRRRHHHRRIGKKMSSFRRRRRLPPPQEHVRIRRGCNKSHLFLFSVFCLSLSSRAENTKKAVFIYTHRVCLCALFCGKFYLFFLCVLPKIFFLVFFGHTFAASLSNHHAHNDGEKSFHAEREKTQFEKKK